MGRVFVVGAGASVAPPAQLPLFGRLREALLDQLKISGELRKLAVRLAPETFMRAIHTGRLPLDEWVTETLGHAAPNAVHHVLGRALDEGAII